jgi:thioredoxin reductase
MTKYDYVIVGSGIAGLYTALLAKDKGKVLIITKGSISDCNTRHAQEARTTLPNCTIATQLLPAQAFAILRRSGYWSKKGRNGSAI